MLNEIERHYLKHKEELRLQRRHGQVEFAVTMRHILQMLKTMKQPSELRILDVGAGTGRYAIALKEEGYNVEVVELVKRNIDVLHTIDPTIRATKADARNMPFLEDNLFDVVLLLGPLYHLMGDEAKIEALRESARVLKPGGIMFVAYLMNDYSILTYCFAEGRMPRLRAEGFVDDTFHVRTPQGELYDYVRLEDIDRLNAATDLRRERIFSPDGAADFMRTQLNRMTEEEFSMFIDYQCQIAERRELLGAGSHVVDVLRK